MVLDFPIQETDKLVELPAKVIMTNIRHMEECLKSISTYEYIQAVHALHEAQRISVFAVENSACTAEDFATKMTYIGKQVSFQRMGICNMLQQEVLPAKMWQWEFPIQENPDRR